jgi:uncharacterized iron-regulated protein
MIIPFVNYTQKGLSAYELYNSKGKRTSFQKMAQKAKSSDCVLFGEYHDNPISHWLQLELLNAMNTENLALGFEMFESDQQELLSGYVSGKISKKEFEDSCRLWPNYKTDYQPLIDYAIVNKVPCIASNVKRKYASLLFKKGREALDSLPDHIKSQFAPLNYIVDTSLSQNKAILEMGGHAMGMNMLDAQALKDATMAMHIALAFKNNRQVLHFNGAFHSDFYQGILWYLKQEPVAKEKNFLTISTVSQKDVKKLDKEHFGRADFIICVPENMTSTH